MVDMSVIYSIQNGCLEMDIAVDFRSRANIQAPVQISEQPITLTDCFKFLNIYISKTLKWNINSNHIIKKAQQRLYLFEEAQTVSPRTLEQLSLKPPM